MEVLKTVERPFIKKCLLLNPFEYKFRKRFVQLVGYAQKVCIIEFECCLFSSAVTTVIQFLHFASGVYLDTSAFQTLMQAVLSRLIKL